MKRPSKAQKVLEIWSPISNSTFFGKTVSNGLGGHLRPPFLCTFIRYFPNIPNNEVVERGNFIWEKRKPINVQKRPGVALEPSPACPPLKRYLLRPFGSHVLEAQVSHMSKKFNSSFASKEMSLNASWLRKKMKKKFSLFLLDIIYGIDPKRNRRRKTGSYWKEAKLNWKIRSSSNLGLLF